MAQYAIGGATAVLFYAEPTRTYDLDVFVTLQATGEDVLAAREGERGPGNSWRSVRWTGIGRDRS